LLLFGAFNEKTFYYINNASDYNRHINEKIKTHYSYAGTHHGLFFQFFQKRFFGGHETADHGD